MGDNEVERVDDGEMTVTQVLRAGGAVNVRFRNPDSPVLLRLRLPWYAPRSRGDCLVVAWHAQAHHMRLSRDKPLSDGFFGGRSTYDYHFLQHIFTAPSANGHHRVRQHVDPCDLHSVRGMIW